MSSQALTPEQQLDQLLLFQDNFLALTHCQVYHASHPIEEAILKFQIGFISDLNDSFNSAIASLSQSLLEHKQGYELGLRDKFQKLLQADFLPLLRLSRIEITRLSLFGFDIYVEPLQAFLHILSRMDTLKQIILESQIAIADSETAESALEKGWDTYSLYAAHWKLAFNLYILKEYLNVGSKSFLRKDRQIMFTGISNLYAALVQALKARKCMKLLFEIAELNNSLYYFHPSFNYFQLYSLLLPLTEQLEPVFAFTREIAEKCLRTNILTPLLFGFLRNRESFLRFIREADSKMWLPYLNAIIGGIAVNLKLRILEYEEIIQLFEEAVLKAGLLGQIRTNQILGTLQEGWKDAKEFFISAVKIGFNSGDAETWKSIDFQTIGGRIIGSLLDGMLLSVEENGEGLQLYLQNAEEKLDEIVKKISKGKIDMYFVKSAIYQLENELTAEREIYMVIQLTNLIKITSIANEYSLNFAISCFNKISQDIASKSLRQKLSSAAEGINQMLFQLANPNFTFLKDKIADFHKKFAPTSNFTQLLTLYSNSYEPKRCLTMLLSLKIEEDRLQDFILLILSKYVPKPSSRKIVLKTFESEFTTKSSYVNLPYETHCLLNFVTGQLTKGSLLAEKIIKILIKACPWINFALLNFPISTEGELFSFSTWLVENTNYHSLLCYLLSQSVNTILSDKGQDLIKILLFPSILDHLGKRINETEDIGQLKKLCTLAMTIAVQAKAAAQFLVDLLAIQLYLLEKADSVQQNIEIVNEISVVSHLAFGDKLKYWLLSLLQRRIQGKTDLSTGHRKRALKTNNTNVYFLGQTITDQSAAENTYQSVQALKERLSQTSKQQFACKNIQFQQVLQGLPAVQFRTFQSLNQKESSIFLQDVKLFSVPQVPPNMLFAIFSANQSQATSFLSLNFQNYAQIIEFAIKEQKIDFLLKQRFDKNLNRFIPSLLELEKQNNIGLLAKMSHNLSLQEKISISQCFFLQPAIVAFYSEHSLGIEYLTAFNSNNWRILMDYFFKEFTSANLPSVILQYHQFMRITGQMNNQYEKIIRKYAMLFSCFVAIASFKIRSVKELSSSKEQFLLRSANELSSLNIALSSLQLKEILQKMSILNQALNEKHFPQLTQWVDAAKQLNSAFNQHYDGDCLLANFIYCYCLTNQTIHQTHKTELGSYLERYYQDVKQEINKRDYYLPKDFEAVSLKELNEMSNQNRKVVSKQCISQQQVNQKYRQLIDYLKTAKSIQVSGKNISVSTSSNADANKFYVFGCLQSLVQGSERYQLTGALKAASLRTIMPWDILKYIDEAGYSHIMSVLQDQQIAKKNLNFCYKGQPLLPDSQGLRVNDYNKLEYCNRVGLSLLGSACLANLQSFMRGFHYQLSYDV